MSFVLNHVLWNTFVCYGDFLISCRICGNVLVCD